jgi:hypothetical protein
MSTQVALQEPESEWKTLPSRPLDEAVWQAWVAKGRAQDRRSSDTHMKAVKLASIAVLLAAVGLWTYLPPYATGVRFIVDAASLAVMVQAFHARHYARAGIFGTLALVYNPVVPVFSFSGGWTRALVAASAVPFVVSLAWHKIRLADHD